MIAKLDGKMLSLEMEKKSSDSNRIWGLHRALLANKIKGCQTEFEKVVQINGLGFKAAVSGSKVVFSLDSVIRLILHCQKMFRSK